MPKPKLRIVWNCASGVTRCENFDIAMLLECAMAPPSVTMPSSFSTSSIERVRLCPTGMFQWPFSPNTGDVSACWLSSAAAVNSFEVEPGSNGSTSADAVAASPPVGGIGAQRRHGEQFAGLGVDDHDVAAHRPVGSTAWRSALSAMPCRS